MAVRQDVSVVKAMAGRGGFSRRERPLTSSAAKCWASAALPPFPKTRTMPPARTLVAMAMAAALKTPVRVSKKRRRTSCSSAAASHASASVPEFLFLKDRLPDSIHQSGHGFHRVARHRHGLMKGDPDRPPAGEPLPLGHELKRPPDGHRHDGRPALEC